MPDIDLARQLVDYVDTTTEPVARPDHYRNDAEVIMLAPERTDSSVSKPSTRRWLIVAAAAGVLALIAGLVVAGTRSDEDPVPADQPEPTAPVVEPEPEAEDAPAPELAPDVAESAPEDIALTFIEARNGFDSDLALSLFAPSAVFNRDRAGGAESLEDVPGQYDWFRVLDWTWDVQGCASTPGEESTMVVCEYELENALTRTFGSNTRFEVRAGQFEFEVVDGQIVEFSNRFPAIPDSWGGFLFYIAANHPEEQSAMFREFQGRLNDQPVLTDASMSLWEEYLIEWAEAEGES